MMCLIEKRRPTRSKRLYSSAASDVYKEQLHEEENGSQGHVRKLTWTDAATSQPQVGERAYCTLEVCQQSPGIEKKRSHKEKGSAGSAPAIVVNLTTRHGIRPIDAPTFDKANTVASMGGEMAAPEKMNNWRYVELLADSGAVDNVGDPKSFPEYRLRESEGSRSGLHYLAANNGGIRNQGEQLLTCKSSEGIPFKLRMQSAEVSRPILSVIRLTESGKEVTFRKNGGTIRDPKTGMTTEFQRKHGVYVLRMWVRTEKQTGNNLESGSARLGWADNAPLRGPKRRMVTSVGTRSSDT